MKHRFNKVVKLSIYLLCICFAINVNAQIQEPCEWGTGVLPKYEKCVADLRATYDAMLKADTDKSAKLKMSREELYDILKNQYEKLIAHYDKKSYLNEEKFDEFTEKYESLEKTKTVKQSKTTPKKTKN